MEHTKQIIAWELLLVFVFSSLLVIQSVEEKGITILTGRAVAGIPDRETVLAEIEAAIPNVNFLDDVQDVSSCLIVNMNPTTKYSYEIVKVNGVAAVTASDSELCRGTQNEDFIVSYISYEKLKAHLANPDFKTIQAEADGTALYVYPSKYIESGMVVSNPSEFKKKFGTFLNNYFTKEEIKAMFAPKPAEARAPALMSYLFYFILGAIVVVLIIGVVLMQSKKPQIKENLELTAYIKSSLAQGYPEEQIKQALLQSGWEQKLVEEAIKTAKSGIPAQSP